MKAKKIFLFALVCMTSALVSKQSVLVFSPHPDDDVLGCGGTIAQLVRKGNEVTIIYMTSGEAEYYNGSTAELASLREQEARNGAKLLGVEQLVFLRQHDSKLTDNQLKAVSLVKELLRKYNPSLIFVPHKYDNHPDHIATHKIVMAAVREVAREIRSFKTVTVLGFEVWTPVRRVTHKIDISDTIELKMKAMKEHKTQMEIRDYAGAVRALNKYRSIMTFVGGSHAECFQKIDL